ncbi:MAG: hypothetical protein R6V77_04585, partial [Candidatus Cloacimonadaceae bacterium]
MLWLSHAFFRSAAAAQEAFRADWLHILELSLSQRHYALVEVSGGYRLELREPGAEAPIAFYPLSSDDED